MIVGGPDHDKLPWFCFFGNEGTVDFKQEIDRFYLSVFQDNPVSLNSH